MADDERDVQSQLQRDAAALIRAAQLPPAAQALWRAKLRLAWARRRRAARYVSYFQCAAAGLLSLVLVAMAWRSIAASPAAGHPMTIAVAGLTTALVVVILLVVPFADRER